MDQRRRVLAREQRRVQDGRHARREGRQVGADVGHCLDAHREELAVLVERKLGERLVVAPVRIRRERLGGAIRGPLHRTRELPGGPGDHHVLGVEIDLRAEAAPDVARDHAHLVLGQAHDEGGHQQALDMRVLAGHVERVFVLGARVVADRGARLDRVRHEAIVDEVELGDVRGLGEGGIHRGLVADRPDVAGVVRRDLVDLRRALGHRLLALDHGGQLLVVHLDLLRRVARLGERLGDHHCHALADEPDLALCEHGVGRLLHRLAVDIGDQPAARQAAEFGRGNVIAGVDGEHAGGFLRLVY